MAPLTRDVMIAYSARDRRDRRRTGRRCRCSTPTSRCGSGRSSACRGRPGSACCHRSSRLLAADARPALPDVLRSADRSTAPAGRALERGAACDFAIDAGTARAAASASRASTTRPLFMVVHAALAVLLARLCGIRRHRDRHRRSPVAARPHSTTWSACSSTRWCCGPRSSRARRSPTCWPGPGRRISLRSRTRTCRSSGSSRCSNRARSTAHSRCSRCCSSSRTPAPPHLELPGLTVETVDVDPGVAKFDLQLTLARTSRRAGHRRRHDRCRSPTRRICSTGRRSTGSRSASSGCCARWSTDPAAAGRRHPGPRRRSSATLVLRPVERTRASPRDAQTLVELFDARWPRRPRTPSRSCSATRR